MAAVMDIERRLGESYNDKAPSLHPEGEVTKIKAEYYSYLVSQGYKD